METFVIRIWAPADKLERDEPGQLQGRLEHVTSGRNVVFHGIDNLGPLITDELRRADDHPGATREKE
jgi:hypothetical protein